MIPWLLTRSEDDNRALATALAGEGVPSVSLPCIEFVTQEWPNLAAYSVVLVTSRRAAMSLPLPVSARVAALASATQEALVARGVTPWRTASGGAVGLAKAIVGEITPNDRVLYAHSDAANGRCENTEAKAILAPHCVLDFHEVYGVRAPRQLAASVSALGGSAYRLLLASPSAVEHLTSLKQAHTLPIELVAVWGESTQRALARCAPKWHETHVMLQGPSLLAGLLQVTATLSTKKGDL